MRGIESYNDMSFLAKHEDLMYAVRGEVQHNLHTTNKRQYDLPLERENDPLSLFEKCYATMRARTFTQPATEVDETQQRRWQCCAPPNDYSRGHHELCAGGCGVKTYEPAR